ncbi:MAG TPA: hypothetical protein VNS33_05970 [Bradyrhizobium sp.]|nr:hypothetical protein [Bradyrhizobium sp.]
MFISTARPAPGTDAYWHDRQAAFALIRELETAIAQRARAPLYLAGPSYDPDDNFDDVIENTGPWDRVCNLQDRGSNNPTVVEILTASKRLALLTT